MPWPKIEVAVRTLEDEMSMLRARVSAIPPGKSFERMRALAAIATLEWIRHGGIPPHERFGHERFSGEVPYGRR